MRCEKTMRCETGMLTTLSGKRPGKLLPMTALLRALRPAPLVLALAAVACGTGSSETGGEASDSDLSAASILDLGTIAPGETKTVDYTSSPTYRAFSFAATKDQNVDFWVRASGADPVAYILSPSRATIVRNDDADGTTTDARVTTKVSADGTYFIAFKELKRRPATISVAFTGSGSGPSPDAQTLSTWGKNTCGIRTDGSIVCWGWALGSLSTPPAGTFRSVSVGDDYGCGVRNDATIACWGDNEFGRATPPTGTFRSVSADSDFACGLRTDNTITCWGAVNVGQGTTPGYVPGPPTGTFQFISSSCGVRTDDSLACWGINYQGQAVPPAGAFRSVNGYGGRRCGIKTDGYLACWGFDGLYFNGDTTYRSLGPLRSVSVGESSNQACAIRMDNSLVCWGRRYDTGAFKPPPGTFRSVTVSDEHACAVSTDGHVACWAELSDNQGPPNGDFL
jgi:hypothetical protein